ncbi:MAG: ABC transporter ATP-binding protein, partial [Actinobacteria bacterium]|nr:ABC transporter ATP-binding protein [Actinomycetota bacterium]
GRLLPDLSGGELQRAIFAGALTQGASLVLLDEPTAHLDPAGRREVEQTIDLYHREESVAYILVTHDITLASRICERVVVLHEGAIIWDGLTRAPELSRYLSVAYGVPFVEVISPATGLPIIVPE